MSGNGPSRSTSGRNVFDRARRVYRRNSKRFALGYPLLALILLFAIPVALLVVMSFFPKPSGEYYRFGFTLRHYRRLFTVPLYLNKLAFTIWVSMATAFLCLFLGYPVAYFLSRLKSNLRLRVAMIVIISSMWLTYIIRAYAWSVILAKNGILNDLLMTAGVIGSPLEISPGIWAMMIGMTYVFLPFAILTLYSSINNINPELEEASKNLGANRFQTFRKIVLPLSRNGIFGAWMLVFILAVGAYVVPSILGSPSEWTLPVIIADQVTLELNVPFGAALSFVLMLVVVVFLAIGSKYMGVSSSAIAGATPDDVGDSE